MTTALEEGEGSASCRDRFYSRERPGTRCTGGWVGPRAGLDRCIKSRPHRDSIPGPSSPWPVAIPTELPGPFFHTIISVIISSTEAEGGLMISAELKRVRGSVQ